MNKKLLTVAVSSALAAPMAAHAVKYKLSGQINRAAVYQNDGQNSDVQFIDNESSGTRWRLTGSEDIGSGMKVGFNWEWQNSSNGGGSGIRDTSSGSESQSQAMRKAEVWFSGGWGKVSLGQGDGAGNGATEVDLTSTWNVAYSGRDSFAGGVAWRTGAGGSLTSGGTSLTHGDTFNSFDAFSRYDRVRYDSPALGPVTLSVSAGQSDRYEGAVRWSQGLGGGQISAALFYGQDNGGGDLTGPVLGVKNRYGGSAAYLFSFGTSLQFSYAENEVDATPGTITSKGKTWYVKVGHNWGNNSVSFGYGESEDANPNLVAFAGSGWKDKGFNIGYNYNIPKAKVDLYAGIHGNQLDLPAGVTGTGGGASVDDIYAVVIGTKLKFD
jgi:predicted porin